MLLTADRTELTASAFVTRSGNVFAIFDSATQDSGNVSYGVSLGEERLFVKTAGSPRDTRPFLSHADRVQLLRNAARLARSVTDPALPVLRNVVESPEGPVLVYEWLEGELVGTPADRRSDPLSAFARFRALPALERVAALDVVFRLHVRLAAKDWVATDFYDGCLLYDFATRALHVIDLDTYHQGPFVNRMGRMFGSTRFMAPEEYELGAPIDERTTVFTMGRTVEQFLTSSPDESIDVRRLVSRACQADRRLRFASVAEFYEAWSETALPAADPA